MLSDSDRFLYKLPLWGLFVFVPGCSFGEVSFCSWMFFFVNFVSACCPFALARCGFAVKGGASPWFERSRL